MCDELKLKVSLRLRLPTSHVVESQRGRSHRCSQDSQAQRNDFQQFLFYFIYYALL